MLLLSVLTKGTIADTEAERARAPVEHIFVPYRYTEYQAGEIKTLRRQLNGIVIRADGQAESSICCAQLEGWQYQSDDCGCLGRFVIPCSISVVDR